MQEEKSPTTLSQLAPAPLGLLMQASSVRQGKKNLKTHLNDRPISGLSVVANYKNTLCAFSGNLILLP